MSELLLLLAAAIILPLWVAIIIRWRVAITGLLWLLPFSGVPILLSGHSAAALLAKDIAFVVPLYLSFFLFNLRELKAVHVPTGVLVAMLFLSALVFLQSLNPEVPNMTAALIGAKVWLFYWPLAFIAGALIKEPQDHIRILRLMTALAVIPCTVGLLQWFLSATIGYEAAMTSFYGKAAEDATQGFNTFDYGGSYFRIPSTFSFPTQYFGYLMAMLVVTYILKQIDPNPKWRRWGRLIFYYVVVAAFLSGSRAAFVFVPLLVAMMYLIDGRVGGMMAGALMIPLLLFTALYLGGVDPLMILGGTQKLTGAYGEQYVLNAPIKALEEVPFGLGTGAGTGPARYAYPDEHLPSDNLSFSNESYYVKAVIELGVPGLLAVIALFGTLIAQALRVRRLVQSEALRTPGAAYAALAVVMAINSIKGWQLDFDPMNVYFWLFMGILFKLPYLGVRATSPAPARRSQPAFPARPAPMIRRPVPRLPR